ncbi:MAG: hypothetical protein N4A54_12575 [Peptostreptococcaceae bacterium]|jgi:hypothetical protein|nr:hypothetical protein [Peptostreptococcaceae bacterium]
MCFVLSIHFYGIFGFEKTASSSKQNVISNLNNDIENEISKKNDDSISKFNDNNININDNNNDSNNNNDNIIQSKSIDDNSNNTSNLNFTYNLKSGSTASKVANELYDQNIISSKDEFLKLLKNQNLENSLKIGTYEIKQGSSITNIINMLTK